MNISTIKSRMVGNGNRRFFVAEIGSDPWHVGICVYDWGVRLMFIFWHVCIHR